MRIYRLCSANNIAPGHPTIAESWCYALTAIESMHVWSKNQSVLRYQYLNSMRTRFGAFVHYLRLVLQSTDRFESNVEVMMDWARMLAYITGTVDQKLLLRNEYLAAENRILRAQINTRLLLSDVEKKTLADIDHRLGRKALDDVANAAKPDTIIGWYRKLVARKFDGAKSRRYPGRPRIDPEVEQLVGRMAKENSDWGYDRIVGAMANLGYTRC